MARPPGAYGYRGPPIAVAPKPNYHFRDIATPSAAANPSPLRGAPPAINGMNYADYQRKRQEEIKADQKLEQDKAKIQEAALQAKRDVERLIADQKAARAARFKEIDRKLKEKEDALRKKEQDIKDIKSRLDD